MLLKNMKLGICALALSALSPFGADHAHAITIGGTQYNEIASGSLGGSFGIWKTMAMGYTYADWATRKNAAFVPISNLDVSAALADADEPAGLSVEFMLKSGGIFFGDLRSSALKLRDASGEVLLELALSGPGKTSGIAAFGTPAKASVTGLYNVVGGSWMNGVLTGSVYADVTYEYAYELGKDFHLRTGSFTLYAPRGAPTEVPEPASVALLVSGLLGVKRMRRRVA